MFDSMIAEADERFNLDGKARILLSSLLALMTDSTRGGLAVFLEDFNQSGLDDATDSWIDTGENIEISKEQLESVFGAETLENISNQTKTKYSVATSALAFMIPRTIDALTPDGGLPKDENLISKIGSYLKETDGAVNSITETSFERVTVASVAKVNPEQTNIVDADVNDKVSVANDKISNHSNRVDSPFAWILPLILLGLLLTLGYWSCSKSPQNSPPTNPNTNNTNQ